MIKYTPTIIDDIAFINYLKYQTAVCDYLNNIPHMGMCAFYTDESYDILSTFIKTHGSSILLYNCDNIHSPVFHIQEYSTWIYNCNSELIYTTVIEMSEKVKNMVNLLIKI